MLAAALIANWPSVDRGGGGGWGPLQERARSPALDHSSVLLLLLPVLRAPTVGTSGSSAPSSVAALASSALLPWLLPTPLLPSSASPPPSCLLAVPFGGGGSADSLRARLTCVAAFCCAGGERGRAGDGAGDVGVGSQLDARSRPSPPAPPPLPPARSAPRCPAMPHPSLPRGSAQLYTLACYRGDAVPPMACGRVPPHPPSPPNTHTHSPPTPTTPPTSARIVSIDCRCAASTWRCFSRWYPENSRSAEQAVT